VQAAVELGVPVPVLSAALFERFESRGAFEYPGKILSAMRQEFGGHIERKS
jgi:6-phosphogluconate dehydrogenase